MPNPYPTRIDDETGTARLEGDQTFTDPANQPGDGGNAAAIDGVTVTGVPGVGDIIVATAATTATWQDGPLGTAPFGLLVLIAVGSGPYAVAFSPSLDLAYVVNNNDNTVTPIVASTGIPGAPIAVGLNPQSVAFSPSLDLAYVANSGDNTVTPIVASTGVPGAPIAVGNGPHAVAFSPLLDLAYVVNNNDNTVSVIVRVPYYAL